MLTDMNLDPDALYLLQIILILVVAFFIMWGIIFRTKFDPVMKEACLAILEGEELEGLFASIKLQGVAKTPEACLNKAMYDKEFKAINENSHMCARVFHFIKYVIWIETINFETLKVLLFYYQVIGWARRTTLSSMIRYCIKLQVLSVIWYKVMQL